LLAGKKFEDFIHADSFWRRVCALADNEIQFLDTWGVSFRKAFQQIGIVHRRLRPGTIIMATTATLLAGPPRERILNYVGLGGGNFHEIQTSKTISSFCLADNFGLASGDAYSGGTKRRHQTPVQSLTTPRPTFLRLRFARVALNILDLFYFTYPIEGTKLYAFQV
jgi:hypothetical protein